MGSLLSQLILNRKMQCVLFSNLIILLSVSVIESQNCLNRGQRCDGVLIERIPFVRDYYECSNICDNTNSPNRCNYWSFQFSRFPYGSCYLYKTCNLQSSRLFISGPRGCPQGRGGDMEKTINAINANVMELIAVVGPNLRVQNQLSSAKVYVTVNFRDAPHQTCTDNQPRSISLDPNGDSANVALAQGCAFDILMSQIDGGDICTPNPFQLFNYGQMVTIRPNGSGCRNTSP